MFHAPMGRFQLESKLELPAFSGFTVQLVVFVPEGLKIKAIPILLT
jgi:hypothetical protein